MDSAHFPERIPLLRSKKEEVRGIATSYFDTFEKNNALLRESSNYGAAA